MLRKQFKEVIMTDFEQWLTNELDYAEDRLYNDNLPACMYIETKARYDTLREIRDKYYENKNAK